MLVTLPGMVMLARLLHPSNALFQILVIPLGSIALVTLEQFWNALLTMCVRPVKYLRKSRFVKTVLSLN